jgi:hypothetical protein
MKHKTASIVPPLMLSPHSFRFTAKEHLLNDNKESEKERERKRKKG